MPTSQAISSGEMMGCCLWPGLNHMPTATVGVGWKSYQNFMEWGRKLSQRKEVVLGHVFYQNKMEEGRLNRKYWELPTCLLSVLSHSQPMENTKNYIPGTHHQDCYSCQQCCPSQDAVSLTASTFPSPFSHPPHPTHCRENIIYEWVLTLALATTFFSWKQDKEK